MYISSAVVTLAIQLVLLPSHPIHCTSLLLDLVQRSYVSVPSAVTGGFGVTCLRPALVINALTVHLSFSSFLVVARRHYRYTFIHRGQSLTAPPPGFHFNKGQEYIPFLITQDGKDWPAKYMQVVMTSDPYAIGIREGDTSVYSGHLTAQLVRDLDHPVKYTHNNFIFFKNGFVGRGAVDASLEELGDLSLKAEVHRYRCTCEEIAHLQQEINTLQGHHYTAVTNRLTNPSHGGTYVVEGRLLLGSDWLIVVYKPCLSSTFTHRRAL